MGMVHWSPSPAIFHLGPLEVRWYGLMFVLGFFLGLQYMFRVVKIESKREDLLDQLLLYVVIGTTIGARLGHTLFYEPAYYFSHPLEILMIWRGGLASHGGTIGVILAVGLFARKHKDYPFMWILDRISVPTTLTASFIRIGNLMNSEIIGRPTDVPWAFIFERVDQLPRHPSQLYESLAYFLIFLTGFWLYSKRKKESPPGLVFGWTVGWIYLARIFIEFTKENQTAWESQLPLNMGQLLSIPFVLICFWISYKSYKKIPIDSL